MKSEENNNRRHLLAEEWSDRPGGFVCVVCGVPVDREPCEKHNPTVVRIKGYFEGHKDGQVEMRERISEAQSDSPLSYDLNLSRKRFEELFPIEEAKSDPA